MGKLLLSLIIFKTQDILKWLEISKAPEIPKGFEIVLECTTVLALRSLMETLLFSLHIFCTQYIYKGLENSKVFEITKWSDITLLCLIVLGLSSLIEKLLFTLNICNSQYIYKGIKISKGLEILIDYRLFRIQDTSCSTYTYGKVTFLD